MSGSAGQDLAQVAACANTQISVSKTVEDGATFTHVRRLDGDERVEEVARIASLTECDEHGRALKKFLSTAVR